MNTDVKPSKVERRLLFDHLPKCGGMTVDKNLIQAYPSELVFTTSGGNLFGKVNEFKNLSQEVRWRFELISGHLTNELVDYVHPATLNITMLREPIDRIISFFKHAIRTESHYLHEFILSNKLSNLDFEIVPTIEVRNWYVHHFSAWTKEEVVTSPKESLEAAYKNILANYKVIGFQDKMDFFLNYLEKEFELELNYKKSFRNKSPKSDPEIIFDEDFKKKITEANSLDIELFERLMQLRKNGLIIN
jgi:hypothetical protein